MKGKITILLIMSILLVSGCVNQPGEEADDMGSMKLTSTAFGDNGNIPAKYTCQGEDISPPLGIQAIPGGTKSLVLIMDDPDAPVGTWVHWVLWNISAVPAIGEDSVPKGAVEGRNSWGSNGYGGPCPPSGTHRYMFKLYALDTELKLGGSSGKVEVERAMQGHILAQARLTGLYAKK